jgi:hypothetical protein
MEATSADNIPVFTDEDNGIPKFVILDEWDEEDEKKGKIKRIVWTDEVWTPNTTRIRKVPDAPPRLRRYRVYENLTVIPIDYSSQ